MTINQPVRELLAKGAFGAGILTDEGYETRVAGDSDLGAQFCASQIDLILN